MPVTIREAVREDSEQIFRFICDLAEYENALDKVLCSGASLAKGLFDGPRTAFALMLEDQGQAIGYALFFYNYSTWTGTRGIYLEDLYVDPLHRGKGAGLLAMRTLAKKACEEGCSRFEWAVLDWNTPSIEFYQAIGASHQSEWQNYRIDGNELRQLAYGGHSKQGKQNRRE